MTRNKLATHKSLQEKNIHYQLSCAKKELAYKSDGTSVLLSERLPTQVEFIGGLWRVQTPFPHTIHQVRGIDFVLLEKLPHTEKTLFEFYRAAMVGENCYGRYVADTSYIVAKYTTNDGTFWGYGHTIEQARAFLGVKLYDQYKDFIHKFACQGLEQNQQK